MHQADKIQAQTWKGWFRVRMLLSPERQIISPMFLNFWKVGYQVSRVLFFLGVRPAWEEF